jgi:hypothetical protein
VYQNRVEFVHLKNTFPTISDVKIKEGVFVGPNIGELIQDVKFANQLSEVEKSAWKSFKHPLFFFGNCKAENFRDMVADLVNPTKLWGVICL